MVNTVDDKVVVGVPLRTPVVVLKVSPEGKVPPDIA